MRPFFAPRTVQWMGIILIALTGLIHLYDAPEYYNYAAYLGILFVANAVAAAVAAVGIARNAQGWGWGLGGVVAGGALVMYVVSRTAGLPGLPDDDRAWLDTLGVLSLVVEGLFVVLWLWLMQGQSRMATDITPPQMERQKTPTR